ncbi:MAG: HD domain-containing protein [Coriobacteriia bacterium]|nr:HD domain-containing protein [Coriobacteriia bacterium]
MCPTGVDNIQACHAGILLDDFSPADLDDLLGYLQPELRGHSRRVGVCASLIAGYADTNLKPGDSPHGISYAAIAYIGGCCHDIGKLLIDDTDYKQHPSLGSRLLTKHSQTLFDNDVVAQMVIDVVSCHHEAPNGSGFPLHLAASNIPYLASICTLADWLDHHLYAAENSDVATVLCSLAESTGVLVFESVIDCFWQVHKEILEKYSFWSLQNPSII